MRNPFTILVSILWFAAIIPLLAQDSVNCFLKDFGPKDATIPLYEETNTTSADPTVTVTVNANDTIAKVSKYIYGNNANSYMGQMVTQARLIGYIGMLSPNVLRFPGGSLSSIYFWNAPTNSPPADAPDTLIDGTTGTKYKAGYWYGRDNDSWTISLDNYYFMLSLTNSTGIITINDSYARYGTGPNPVATAAHYAADWVRYDNGRTKFWEIGNESGGAWEAGYQIDTKKNQDGQPAIISGNLYGKHFKMFADSMRKAAQEVGSTISIGGQLVQYDASNSSEPDRSWNSGFFSQAGDSADFFIVHSYYTNYNENSSAAVILSSAATQTDLMMNTMKQTTSKNKVVLKPIALTEWNIFAIGSKQMTSFVNGIHAAIVLGELAKTGFSMASRWNLANGYNNGNDHGMFNIGDEPGVIPKWNPRPVFFTMYYFQKCFGDHIVSSSIAGSNDVLAYASKFHSGHAGIVVVNKGTTGQVVKLIPNDFGFGERFYAYSLTGGSDNGEFSQVVNVNGHLPTHTTGGPIDSLEEIPARAYIIGDGIKFMLPARSVQYILIEPGDRILSAGNERKPEIVDRFILHQNYPNPFNPQTTIRYALPRGSTVTLKVYDVLGREVATLVHNERIAAGNHEVSFNAENFPSGMYFYRLQTEGYVETKQMVLIR